MPRIRSIKPQFWTDETLCELPRDVRLLFLGLISAMADDEGRLKGNPKVVRAAVFPLDDDVTAAQVAEWMGALERAGRIARYVVNGEAYVRIPNWKKHQRIDRPQKSQLPAPPDDAGPRADAPSNGHGGFVERSTNGPRIVAEPSSRDKDREEGGDEGEEISPSLRSGDAGPGRVLAVVGAAPESPNGAKAHDDAPPTPPPEAWGENWPARFAELIAAKAGHFPAGRVGRALKPLTLTHPEPLVREAMLDSIEAAKAKGREWRPEWFAQSAARWLELARLPYGGPGGLTPRGLAVMGE